MKNYRQNDQLQQQQKGSTPVTRVNVVKPAKANKRNN